MKIYIAHSKAYDYKNELYKPIRDNHKLQQENIILPHEYSDTSANTREFYNEVDLIIAECSYPATGLGIELGWAYDSNIPIYCLYKNNMKISGSIHSITNNIFAYSNADEMVEIIRKIISLEKK